MQGFEDFLVSCSACFARRFCMSFLLFTQLLAFFPLRSLILGKGNGGFQSCHCIAKKGRIMRVFKDSLVPPPFVLLCSPILYSFKLFTPLLAFVPPRSLIPGKRKGGLQSRHLMTFFLSPCSPVTGIL